MNLEELNDNGHCVLIYNSVKFRIGNIRNHPRAKCWGLNKNAEDLPDIFTITFFDQIVIEKKF